MNAPQSTLRARVLRPLYFSLVSATFVSVSFAYAAESPRIGLALSGGGARGAAHIGVLKVLEEMRVPVHCIAGTSMGAVVGGAYAAGNSPQDMEMLIADTDWTDVFNDRPPRREIPVRRKSDDYKTLFAPEFGLNDGTVQLPKGVVAGVTIEGFLRRLALPAASVRNFDDLGVPYRAVGADLETGRAVIISKGSLAHAMRASMAVPGAVAPIEIDGRLLVDGGIANNLPINIARDMCADVVIAVNISTPVLKRAEITSALGVVEQLINLLGKETVDRQIASLRSKDVLIEPALGDITASSFERQKEAITIGETAARGVAAKLRAFSVSETEYLAFKRRQSAGRAQERRIAEVKFEGLERTSETVLSQLVDAVKGNVLSVERLNADIRRVFGRGDFEAADYRVDPVGVNNALVISLREKSTGPNFLRFGLGLASDFKGEASFNALVNYRKTWLNKLGGEWLTDFQIGRNNLLFSEFYQPVNARGDLFVTPYVQLAQDVRGIFLDDQRLVDYKVRDARVGFDVGTALGTWGEFRVGPLYRRITASVSTGLLFPSEKTSTAGIRMRFVGDQFDTPWFPRSGHREVINLYSGSRSGNLGDYRRLDASFASATSRGANTLAFTALVGSSMRTELPGADYFALGGPLRLSGYRTGQFQGQEMAFASARYERQLYKLPSVLGSGMYAGVSAEWGRMRKTGFSALPDTGQLWSGSVYLAAETFLGPGFLGLGFGAKGNVSLYLSVGAGNY